MKDFVLPSLNVPTLFQPTELKHLRFEPCQNSWLGIPPITSLYIFCKMRPSVWAWKWLTGDRPQDFLMANSAEGEEGKLKNAANLGLRKNYHVKCRLDGGYSWIACVVGFFIMFIIGGQNNCSGIIFTALLDEYNTNRGQTGKIFCFVFGLEICSYIKLYLNVNTAGNQSDFRLHTS